MPTILVVEDEQSIAMVLHAILEDDGYNVVLARDGREALGMLPTVDPALVITDLMMPHVDGLTLCRAMRADPAYHAIPVILMSAIAEPLVTEGCHYAAFIKKPFALQVVVNTITNVLGLGEQARG